MSSITLQERAEMTNPHNNQLIQKWGHKLALVEKAQNHKMNFETKLATAKCLENTSKQVNYLNETTQQSDIGAYKRYAIDMISALVPNLIAPEICSVQAMENRVGMVNYLSFSYGTAKAPSTENQQFADSFTYGPSNPYYTSQDIVGEAADGSGTSFSGNLSWLPIIPGSIQFIVDGKLVTDDGAGKLVGDAVSGSSNTIDYTTGAYSITLKSSATDTPTFNYKFSNEMAPTQNVPDMNMKVISKPITAQPRRLKALYAFEAGYEFQKEYGGNIDETLAIAAAGEIAHEIDTEIVMDMKNLANPEATIQSWDATAPVGVSLRDHYDSFLPVITEAQNKIYQVTNRARGNFIVCGTGVATVIQSIRNFESSGVTDTVGPYFAGTLPDGTKVYVAPMFDPLEYMVGYKGNGLFDAGYFYCPYMPITMTDLVTLEDFATRRGWATMYGKTMIQPKYYLRGRITGGLMQ